MPASQKNTGTWGVNNTTNYTQNGIARPSAMYNNMYIYVI